MSALPRITPLPTSIFTLATSPAVQGPSQHAPTLSAIPADTVSNAAAAAPSEGDKDDDKDAFKLPKLRLEIRDLNHPGAKAFLGAVNAGTCLEDSVRAVLSLLYVSPSCAATHVPPTRSVTLILRDMPGVAYTTGSDLDNDHKEIHLSLAYVAGVPAPRAAAEVAGVVTHELVHCYQYNGRGACPGGLVEGVADWVRLSCRLSPPHWKRDASGSWDGGYQHTAYFLEYLEGRFGSGTVRRLNESLRAERYEEKRFWVGLLGRPVQALWEDYREKLRDDEAVIVNKEDISDDGGRETGGI